MKKQSGKSPWGRILQGSPLVSSMLGIKKSVGGSSRWMEGSDLN